MLADQARMQAYTSAIQKLCSGKVVIDVGAGTGALSILAAQSGARAVYAIEASKIADYAEKMISSSGFKEKIVLMKEMAEDIDWLPH